MAAEIEDLTLEMLRAIRRDRELACWEMRKLSRAIVGLSENVMRQGMRLELAIGDLRLEFETLFEVEVGRSLADIEARVEDRLMTEIKYLQRQVDDIRQIGCKKEQGRVSNARSGIVGRRLAYRDPSPTAD